MGNRMSSLPIAQFCAMAGELDRQHGAGRAAAMSTAFHALQAGQGSSAFDLLTDEEQEEVSAWQSPGDFEVPGVGVLRYSDAEKELEVGIDRHAGVPWLPEDTVSVGHIDMAWVIVVNGRRIAVIGDIKKSDFSSPDGPTSLQMEGYGLAYAAARNCSGYICGHWNATEGHWTWGPYRDLADFETMEPIVARVVGAALNLPTADRTYSTGPHCVRCWSRMHCPEYLLPLRDPVAALAPFVEPGGLQAGNRYEALQLYQKVQELVKLLKTNLQASVVHLGPIPDGAGKEWREVKVKGGRKLDHVSMASEHPELAAKYMKDTPPRSGGFKWLNEK